MALRSTGDRLINLPQGTLENIFSSLSIRDLVRTSVLSTKWRNKWISFPHLIFDDHCAPFNFDRLPNYQTVLNDNHDMLVKIVNHVLLIHRGPIQTFKISSSYLKRCSEIDSWILYLSSNSVEEFELNIAVELEHYGVIHSLFSFKHLISLKLTNCILVPPPLMFKGFRVLKSLFLHRVELSHTTLECLVSSCPELVYARFYISSNDHPYQWETCNAINRLCSLLRIRTLELNYDFLEYISCEDVPRKVLCSNVHLRSLKFAIPLSLWNTTGFLVALCLLNSAPNVEDLGIEICWGCPEIDFEEAKDGLGFTFNKLKYVEIDRFCGSEIELILIKNILANAPVLETMKIVPLRYSTDNFSEQLLRFKRASPQAEVIYSVPSQWSP